MISHFSNNGDSKVDGSIIIPIFEILGILLISILSKYLFQFKIGISTRNLIRPLFILGWPAILLALINLFEDNLVWDLITHTLPIGQIFVAIIAALISGLIVGTFEELLARAGLFPLLTSMLPKKNIPLGITFSALLFSLLHLINLSNGVFWDTINQLVYAFGIGILFATIYYLTGNILVTVLLHSFIDFTDNIFSMITNYEGVGHYASFTLSSPLISIFLIVFSYYIFKRYDTSDKYKTILKTFH